MRQTNKAHLLLSSLISTGHNMISQKTCHLVLLSTSKLFKANKIAIFSLSKILQVFINTKLHVITYS